jgi:hypothetical protein
MSRSPDFSFESSARQAILAGGVIYVAKQTPPAPDRSRTFPEHFSGLHFLIIKRAVPTRDPFDSGRAQDR